MKMHCKFCGYEWIARVSQPKECPRCKARLDRVNIGPNVKLA